jgi:hypothetical protein
LTPRDRITKYLFDHKSKLEFSTIDMVVKDIKLAVFYNMSTLTDEEIRQVVSLWATTNAIGWLVRQPTVGLGTAKPLPGDPPPPPPPPAGNSEFIDAVQKAISTINKGVVVGKEGAKVKIGVTGLTANLKPGDGSVSVGISWTGTLLLDAESGPFHFSGTLSKDEWAITLSFPQDTYIPDKSSLGTVFKEGETAIRRLADATRSFNNVNDVNKVSALIKPHAAAIEKAVEAAAGLAKADKKGGPSFGFKLGSPEPGPGEQGMPKGVQGTLVFTYRF